MREIVSYDQPFEPPQEQPTGMVPAGNTPKPPGLTAQILILGEIAAGHIGEDATLADALTPRLRETYNLLRQNPAAPIVEVAQELGVQAASLYKMQARMRDTLLNHLPPDQLPNAQRRIDVITGKTPPPNSALGRDMTFEVQYGSKTKAETVLAIGQVLVAKGVDPSSLLTPALQRLYATIAENPTADANELSAKLNLSPTTLPNMVKRIFKILSPHLPVNTPLPASITPKPRAGRRHT